MKSAKHIVQAAVLAAFVFCAIVYTSCQKSTCQGVTCLNTGTCNGAACNCPPGVLGGSCETILRQLYANTYVGNAAYNISYTDTNFKSHTDPNNNLAFTAGTDSSSFDSMTVVWNRGGNPPVNMAVTLSSNTTAGSVIKVTGTQDTFTFAGSGTLSSTSASLNLVQTGPCGCNPVTITLSNFAKQ